MKRKFGSILMGIGGVFGISALWADASHPMTHSQGVAAAVTTSVLLLAGGLIFE